MLEIGAQELFLVSVKSGEGIGLGKGRRQADGDADAGVLLGLRYDVVYGSCKF